MSEEKPFTAGELNHAVETRRRLKINEIRQVLRDSAHDLQYLVEHPEIMDGWSPAQVAWYKEHLELNMEALKKLQTDIADLLEKKKQMR